MSKYSEHSDEDIALQVQKGDTESFRILVERYEAKMIRYGRKFFSNSEDIADLVQEAFIKTYVNIQDFNPKRKFSPWIYRIAHNEFINAIKKKKREPLSFFDTDTLFPHPAAREKTDQEINERELREMLDRHLKKLDLKYREPLILFYYEEMDYKQIAEILRIPTATVGIRLRRGRAALRKMMV